MILMDHAFSSGVICLQGEALNRNGELYVRKHSSLKIKLVDGSSLAAAIVINSIPSGTAKILVGGNLTKVSVAIVKALCRRGIVVRISLLVSYYGSGSDLSHKKPLPYLT